MPQVLELAVARFQGDFLAAKAQAGVLENEVAAVVPRNAGGEIFGLTSCSLSVFWGPTEIEVGRWLN